MVILYLSVINTVPFPTAAPSTFTAVSLFSYLIPSVGAGNVAKKTIFLVCSATCVSFSLRLGKTPFHRIPPIDNEISISSVKPEITFRSLTINRYINYYFHKYILES